MAITTTRRVLATAAGSLVYIACLLAIEATIKPVFLFCASWGYTLGGLPLCVAFVLYAVVGCLLTFLAYGLVLEF